MRLKIAIVIVALAASSAFAASKEDLNWFAGDWKCSGVAFAGPAGPEHKTMATAHARWALGGAWLDLHYAENKTKENARPFAINAYWGYDRGSKKIVAGYVDNMGGYGTQAADGWKGDTLAFEGSMHAGAMQMKARDTFIKKGKKELEHTAEYEDNGVWKKATQENCKR